MKGTQKYVVGSKDVGSQENNSKQPLDVLADPMFQDLWPLPLVDALDEEQMTILYRLLRYSPHAIQWYLYEFVFPETMEFQPLKLSASGQELGREGG